MRMQFSQKFEELYKKIEPYCSPRGGLAPDAPEDVKKAFEACKKLYEEEKWL